MKLIPRWHQEKCWSSCIKVQLFSNISMFILKLELYLAFVAVCVLSPVWLFGTAWTVAHQAPLSMGFPRQEYWSGLLFPSAGDLPDPGIEPMTLRSPALASRFFTTGTTWVLSFFFLKSEEWLHFSHLNISVPTVTDSHRYSGCLWLWGWMEKHILVAEWKNTSQKLVKFESIFKLSVGNNL